jgi:hypothetical protein
MESISSKVRNNTRESTRISSHSNKARERNRRDSNRGRRNQTVSEMIYNQQKSVAFL